jgi:hypothetical protein
MSPEASPAPRPYAVLSFSPYGTYELVLVEHEALGRCITTWVTFARQLHARKDDEVPRNGAGDGTSIATRPSYHAYVEAALPAFSREIRFPCPWPRRYIGIPFQISVVALPVSSVKRAEPHPSRCLLHSRPGRHIQGGLLGCDR